MSEKTKIHVILICCAIRFGFVTGKIPDCTGQTLGEQNPTHVGATAGTNSGTSYLLRGPSVAIPCCGIVSGLSYATAAAGDLTVQVWRSTGGTYEVVGETVVSGVTAGGTTLNQSPSDELSVEQGDFVGFHSSVQDIISYSIDNDVAMGVVSSGGKTALGGTNAWSSTAVNGQRWNFGVTVSANTPPTFTGLPTSVTATTNDAVGTGLYTFVPTDSNPSDTDLTVTLSAGSAAEFEVVGNDVQIKSALSPGNYEVVAVVSDACGSSTGTLTVQVTENPPNITSLPVAAAYQLREDTTDETLLHEIVYTDIDTPLEDVKCSISSTTPTPAPFHSKYTASGTGVNGIYFIPDSNNHLDNDKVASVYYLNVVCNDGTADSVSRLFQVDIVPNEPPVPTIPASISVSALTDAGTTVHTITATDASVHPDGIPDTVHFTMADCSCPFKMTTDGKIYPTEDLNSHRTSPYVVNITVSDSYKGYSYNTVGPTQMTIHITDINTPPNITNPIAVAPNSQTIYIKEHTEAEDEGVNLIDTILTVFQPDGFDTDGDTIAWDVQFTNDKGEVLFVFDNTTQEIKSAQNLDYETLRDNGLLTTTVEIRASDGREYSDTRTLKLVVTDENEKPEFQHEKYSIETTEGTSTTETLQCPLLEVKEEDYYDTRTYSLSCTGFAPFQLSGSRTVVCDAIVQKTQEYDLDDPGAASEVVTCTITVKDKGGLNDTTILEITIHEEDDNWPRLNQESYTYSITNDTTAGNTFGFFSAEDDDFLAEHRLITYTTDSSEFGVDPNGVFVSTRDWTGVNAPTQRTFTVYATDEAGHVDSATVTVSITDIPPTTTTTTSPTTLPDTYDPIGSFLDAPGNLAWLIPAILLGALLLGLMGFMCLRCCMAPGACLNSCRGGRCFSNGTRGGRGFFGRRTFVNRMRQPKRVVKQPKPVKVVEKQRKIRVVKEPRRVRVVEEPRPVRVVEKPRHVRVVEEPRPLRSTESKPVMKEQPKEPVAEPPKEPVKEEPPKKNGGLSKPKPAEPKAVDEPKQWHLWGKNDFSSPLKSVG